MLSDHCFPVFLGEDRGKTIPLGGFTLAERSARRAVAYRDGEGIPQDFGEMVRWVELTLAGVV